jgi:hypothetical protein
MPIRHKRRAKLTVETTKVRTATAYLRRTDEAGTQIYSRFADAQVRFLDGEIETPDGIVSVYAERAHDGQPGTIQYRFTTNGQAIRATEQTERTERGIARMARKLTRSAARRPSVTVVRPDTTTTGSIVG